MAQVCTTKYTQEQYHEHAYNYDVFLAFFLREIGACSTRSLVAVLDHRGRKFIKDSRLNNPGPSLAECIASGKPTCMRVMISDSRSGVQQAHATIAIAYPAAKEVEYFDSNGALYVVPGVIEMLTAYLDKHLPPGYTVILPSDYCPMGGWQTATKDEMCSNWSMLYAVLRLYCPGIPRDQLIKYLLTKDLPKIMQHWGCYIIQYLSSRGITRVSLKYRALTDKLDKLMEADRTYVMDNGITVVKYSKHLTDINDTLGNALDSMYAGRLSEAEAILDAVKL